MRKGWWVAAFAWILAVGLARASEDHQVESSMLVSGTVSIDESGAVVLYQLDHRDKLPKPVAQLFDQTIPPMHFEPVLRDGRPHAVSARMSAQVIASEVAADEFTLRIGSTRFTEMGQPVTDVPTIVGRPPAFYPESALAAGATGTAYVAVRFDRSGHVLDVAVQHVDLRFDASDAQLQHWRDVFGKSAASFSRHVRFKPPTTGEHANDAEFTGIMPIVYVMGHSPGRYGEWDSYIPGPKQDISWLRNDREATNSEAVPDGEFALSGDGLRPRGG